VKELQEQLRLAQERPQIAPEVRNFEREKDLLNQELLSLQNHVAKSKQLIAALTNKSTVISTLDTLLEKKGTGENKGFEFLVDVVNRTKQSCPGVSNDLLVGFAQNFFPGVIVNNGTLVGIPEGDPCQRFRSIECSGSVTGNQCHACRALSHFISVNKNRHFQDKYLGVYTPIQQEAMKEARASAIPQPPGDVDPECKTFISNLINLVNSRRLSPKSFLFLFMKTQVDNLEKVRKSVPFLPAKISNFISLRKMPSSGDFPQFMHWASSLMYFGGKGTVSWLRSDVGKQVDDDGNYNPDNANFILPSTRTLKKHGPVVDPYGSLARDKVNNVVIGLPKGEKKKKERKKNFFFWREIDFSFFK